MKTAILLAAALALCTSAGAQARMPRSYSFAPAYDDAWEGDPVHPDRSASPASGRIDDRSTRGSAKPYKRRVVARSPKRS